MRKNKFLTAVCMLSAFVGSNLHAKTSKTKIIEKVIVQEIQEFMEFLQIIKVLLLRQK